MKKTFLLAILALVVTVSMAQQRCYWVFFTDKNETHFDPYTYFDAKAIERYERNGADLYDTATTRSTRTTWALSATYLTRWWAAHVGSTPWA